MPEIVPAEQANADGQSNVEDTADLEDAPPQLKEADSDVIYKAMNDLLTSDQIGSVANWAFSDIEYMSKITDESKRATLADAQLDDITPKITTICKFRLKEFMINFTSTEWLLQLHENHRTKVIQNQVISPDKKRYDAELKTMVSTTNKLSIQCKNQYSQNKVSEYEGEKAAAGEKSGAPWTRSKKTTTKTTQLTVDPTAHSSNVPQGQFLANSPEHEIAFQEFLQEKGYLIAEPPTMLPGPRKFNPFQVDALNYGTYNRSPADDAPRFTQPYSHDIINGKHQYGVVASRNDPTAWNGVGFYDPVANGRHYQYSTTESSVKRLKMIMPAQSPARAGKKKTAPPKFVTPDTSLTNFAPTEADECPSFLTNYPGIILQKVPGRPMPASALITEINQSQTNKKCAVHNICGKFLRVGDYCMVDGRDTYHRSKGVMYVGVYVLLPGFVLGCKVGSVRTMFNDVQSVTNRIGYVKYVATKAFHEKDFYTKVGGYAHLVFIDQGRDFTHYDPVKDHYSIENALHSRLEDQNDVLERMKKVKGKNQTGQSTRSSTAGVKRKKTATKASPKKAAKSDDPEEENSSVALNRSKRNSAGKNKRYDRYGGEEFSGDDMRLGEQGDNRFGTC